MHKTVKTAIVVNLLVAILFVSSSVYLWNALSGDGPSLLVNARWGPFTINAMHYHYSYSDGALATVQAIFLYYNFPFWLFLVAIGVNLYFIYKLSKKPNTQ